SPAISVGRRRGRGDSTRGCQHSLLPPALQERAGFDTWEPWCRASLSPVAQRGHVLAKLCGSFGDAVCSRGGLVPPETVGRHDGTQWASAGRSDGFRGPQVGTDLDERDEHGPLVRCLVRRVQREVKLPFEATENHAVAAVVTPDGLIIVHPRPEHGTRDRT